MSTDAKKAGASFLKSLAVTAVAGVIAAQFIGAHNVFVMFGVEGAVGLAFALLFGLHKASEE